jgi:hypothetical protein
MTKGALLAMTVLSVVVFGLTTSGSVKAAEVSSDLNLSVNPVVALSISNCDSSPADSVVLTIEPSSLGAFSSTCQNITVAANTPGYSLLVKSDSTNLIYQNPTTITPAPVVASTDKLIANPDVLPNDTWGFAIENQTDVITGSLINGFNTTYTTNNADNKYAKLLTTDQTIYQTDKALGETPAPLSSFTAYYGARLTLATVAGEYKTTITYTAIGSEVPEPLSVACVSGSAFKGDVGDIRNATTTTASWVIGDTGIANDTRGDGQNYCIGKLADDNIWMLNNLKLGSFDDDMLLTPADSNVTADWTLPKIDNDATGEYYDTPHLYAFVAGQTSFSSDIPNSEETDINSPNFAGYYYNWCAATAGTVDTTCTPYSTEPTDAVQDICPANWQMPIGGGSGEFTWLNAKMNNPDVTSPTSNGGDGYYQNWWFTGPFRGVFAGNFQTSDWSNFQGSSGDVWTASRLAEDSSLVHILNINTGEFGVSAVIPNYLNDRSYGNSVRCVLY